MTTSYLALVRRPPARRLLYALSVTTLSYGMLTLTVLLTVERATGSFGDGGFAVAAFALTAGLSAPLRGRLVDRRGARTWLPRLALGYASALIALDLAAHAGASVWLLLALPAVTGATTPPLFASARAVWPQTVGPELLRHGYALTSLLADVGQVAGPALASLLFLVSGWIGPVAVGLLGVAGALLSVPVRGSERHAPAPRPMPRLLESRWLLGLLVISVALGCAEGLVQVSVPVDAARFGRDALAGPLLAAFALGSVTGALWFGSRRFRLPVIDRYLRAVLALGLLIAPVSLAGGPTSLALLLVPAGLAFGPATVSLFESLDVVAPGSGAEALTWVTTAEAAGSAGGSAVAGALATRGGIAAPFLLASLLLVVPAGLAVVVRRGRGARR